MQVSRLQTLNKNFISWSLISLTSINHKFTLSSKCKWSLHNKILNCQPLGMGQFGVGDMLLLLPSCAFWEVNTWILNCTKNYVDFSGLPLNKCICKCENGSIINQWK